MRSTGHPPSRHSHSPPHRRHCPLRSAHQSLLTPPVQFCTARPGQHRGGRTVHCTHVTLYRTGSAGGQVVFPRTQTNTLTLFPPSSLQPSAVQPSFSHYLYGARLIPPAGYIMALAAALNSGIVTNLTSPDTVLPGGWQGLGRGGDGGGRREKREQWSTRHRAAARHTRHAGSRGKVLEENEKVND